MFAVIKTGGKQYRVVPDQTVTIERIEGSEGSRVEFGQVLMVGEGADVSIGAPAVDGARVTAEVIEQGRGPKTISFKKRRRQNSRRKKGHRQLLTTVSILEILTEGKSPTRDGSGRSAEDRRRERDAAYVATLAGVNADDFADAASGSDATGTDASDAGLADGSAAPATSATASEDDAAGEHVEEQAAMAASAPAASESAAAPQALADDGQSDDSNEADKGTAEVLKEAAEGAAVGAAVGAAAGAAAAAASTVLGDDKPEGPLFEAPDAEPDKLTKIKGIGPVAERQLKEQGITTFAQIASLTEDDIARVDAYMPFSAAQILSWQEQARELSS